MSHSHAVNPARIVAIIGGILALAALAFSFALPVHAAVSDARIHAYQASILPPGVVGPFGPLTKALTLKKYGVTTVPALQTILIGKKLLYLVHVTSLFGPLTIEAVIRDFEAGGTVSGNFPPGCTSASGYSTLTGFACVSLPGGGTGPCSGGALFNNITGASCFASLPAGCTLTTKYSPLSGSLCVASGGG
ncbi:MAG: hypothetical protein PHN89_02105, partial [Candidatus Pacebacteria bacterium]|nr:hypothetical protein [Candidatus Paceibacterota bacterium]